MNRKPDPYGRDATRPYQIPLKGWWQVAQRVWSESSRDNLSLVAAGCAFYALFAIFPILSALISLYAIVADPIHVEAGKPDAPALDGNTSLVRTGPHMGGDHGRQEKGRRRR